MAQPQDVTDLPARAAGALLGMAAGDALGAGYEFGPALPAETEVGMVGGGVFNWEPGEWTDDTSMAIPILDELVAGADLLDPAAMDRVARAWADWTAEATDVGAHTATMFATAPVPVTAASLRQTAAEHFAAGHPSGGNGTLMRTTPIALGFLDDPAGLAAAATAYALLTHGDPEGAEACVLWNLAQRTAIVSGQLDVRTGLSHLAPDRAEVWRGRIGAAETSAPVDFPKNGWVVHALQAAWSAIATTPGTGPDHLVASLERIVRSGGDTDTVAAIAGGLLGAAYGESAVPSHWRGALHGWPGRTGEDLAAAARGVVAAAG